MSQTLDPKRISIHISGQKRETEAKPHTSLVDSLCNDTKHLLIYTDGSQTKGSLNGTGLVAIHAHHHRLEARWNLGRYVEVYDTELFGILQGTSYARKWTTDPNNTGANTIWIFVNNQAAIHRCTTPRPTAGQHFTTQIISNLHHILQNRDDIQVNIRWVPGHTEVIGNETADKCAKSAAELPNRVSMLPHPSHTSSDRPSRWALGSGNTCGRLQTEDRNTAALPGSNHYGDPPGDQSSS